MRTTVFLVAKILGLLALSRVLTRRKLRILGYHGIWWSDGHFGNRIFMKPETFKSRMAWLSRSRFPVLGLDEAVEKLYDGSLPDCAVVVTIDDGWYGTYKHMVPVLSELEMPATVYITTAAVDSQLPHFEIAVQHMCNIAKRSEIVLPASLRNGDGRDTVDLAHDKDAAAQDLIGRIMALPEQQRLEACRELYDGAGLDFTTLHDSRQLHNMTYGEITDMSERGIDVQLHTHNHDLTLEEPERIDAEISLNRDRLEGNVKGPLNHFCYPSGVHSSSMYRFMEKHGVKSSTTVEAGLNDSNTHRYSLSRILDGQYVSQLEIEAELSGFLELKRNLVSALRSR